MVPTTPGFKSTATARSLSLNLSSHSLNTLPSISIKSHSSKSLSRTFRARFLILHTGIILGF